jgi:hypothetical protein
MGGDTGGIGFLPGYNSQLIQLPRELFRVPGGLVGSMGSPSQSGTHNPKTTEVCEPGPLATNVPLSARCIYLYRRAFSSMSKHFIRRIDQVTNMVSNSPAETQPGYRVSTPYSFTALVSRRS